MNRAFVSPWVCLAALTAIPRTTYADEDLAGGARTILQAHCSRCHADGARKGGFDYLLRRDLLAARGKIAPGKAAESELFQKVRDGVGPQDRSRDERREGLRRQLRVPDGAG